MADCPCDDGDSDYPSPASAYAHAEIIDATVYPPPIADQYAQIRRCRRCSAVWWVHVHDFQQEQTDRDGNLTGHLHREDTHGLRCRDTAEAEALTPWYPLLRDAERRFRLADEQSWREPSPEHALAVIAVQHEFAELLRRHPMAGALLAYGNLASSYLNWQPSVIAIRTTAARRSALIEAISAGATDHALRDELSALQTSCAAARSSDPRMDHDSVDLEELWTPDLAAVPALTDELRPLQALAWEKRLDAHGTERIQVIRRSLAAAWRAFHRKVRWPSPEVEFRFLLDYLRTLDPEAPPISADSGDEPERVAFRLRALMQQHHLLPARNLVIVPWLAKLLSIPPTSLDPSRPTRRPPHQNSRNPP